MSRLHLDLCSGIGGFALAAKWNGYETIGFCEIDPWCRRVLGKNFPGIPQHDDLWTLSADVVREWIGERTERLAMVAHAESDARGSSGPKQGQAGTGIASDDSGQFRHELDLITAGYPCQPFSHAGKRLGAEDDRHLWPAIAALVADLRPARCLWENVAGHVTMGLDAVLADLEEIGYAVWPVVIPACAVGAPHRRDRVWILAEHVPDADSCGSTERGQRSHSAGHGAGWVDERTGSDGDPRQVTLRATGEDTGILPNALSIGQPGPWAREYASDQAPDGDWQAGDVVDAGATGTGTEAIGGMGDEADGVSGRLDERPANGPIGRHGGDERLSAGAPEDDRHADCAGWEVQRSEWRVGPDVLNPWAGDWEAGCPRTTTHEPDRANKLKALGNAVVPQVAYEILRAWDEVAA